MKKRNFEEEILKFLQNCNKPVSMKTIRTFLGMKNTVTVSKYLKILENKNMVFSQNSDSHKKLWSIKEDTFENFELTQRESQNES
jgi:predicted AAA+ superfamily ATPase